MATITEQKHSLRGTIYAMVMDEYEDANEREQTYLFAGAIRRLAARMTLRELQDWHDKLERLNEEGEPK